MKKFFIVFKAEILKYAQFFLTLKFFEENFFDLHTFYEGRGYRKFSSDV